MSNTKGKAAIAILGLVGVFALIAASGDKAHAKRVVPPPDEDDVEPPAPAVPMPPPPVPNDGDAVVVESPGAEPAEVPIGDALIDQITYEEPDADPLLQPVPEVEDDDGFWTLDGPWIARFTVLPQTGVSPQQLAAAVGNLADTTQIQISNGAVIFVGSDEEPVRLEQGQPLFGLPGVLVDVERLTGLPATTPPVLPPPPMPTGGDSVIVETPGAEPAEVPIPDEDDEVQPVEEEEEEEPQDDDDVVAPPAQPVPPPAFPPPDMQQAEAPTLLKADTAGLLKLMLTDEMRPNWKRKIPELVPWQAARGLVADGEFGPKSALKMSEETGLLPIVRFWPKGSFPEGKWLPDYQHALRVAAVTAPEPMASQLVAAALRETGQGFGRGQQAISPTIQI